MKRMVECDMYECNIHCRYQPIETYQHKWLMVLEKNNIHFMVDAVRQLVYSRT